MVYLQITLHIAAANRPAAANVYQKYKAPFLNTVTGAKSKELLVRDEDVQVLHGFETKDNANAYLQSELFTADVVAGLKPLLDAAPEVRIYEVALTSSESILSSQLRTGTSTMFQDWNAYRAALMERVGDFASLNPDVMAGLAALDGAVAKKGHLEPKMHELIALAVAVTTRCDGCISVHTQKAVQLGATREEISEALGVAIALNAGAALVYSARVLDTHAQLPQVRRTGNTLVAPICTAKRVLAFFEKSTPRTHPEVNHAPRLRRNP